MMKGERIAEKTGDVGWDDRATVSQGRLTINCLPFIVVIYRDGCSRHTVHQGAHGCAVESAGVCLLKHPMAPCS